MGSGTIGGTRVFFEAVPRKLDWAWMRKVALTLGILNDSRSPACSPRRSSPRIRRFGCHVLAGGPDIRPVGSRVRRGQVPVEPHGRSAAVDRRAAHIAARVCGRGDDVAPSAAPPLRRREGRPRSRRARTCRRSPTSQTRRRAMCPSDTQFLDSVDIG